MVQLCLLFVRSSVVITASEVEKKRMVKGRASKGRKTDRQTRRG